MNSVTTDGCGIVIVLVFMFNDFANFVIFQFAFIVIWKKALIFRRRL